MIPDDENSMKDLLGWLREAGVSAYRARSKDVDFELSFHPGQQRAEPIEPLKEPMCKCGHEEADHGPGGCTHGCEPEKCLAKN